MNKIKSIIAIKDDPSLTPFYADPDEYANQIDDTLKDFLKINPQFQNSMFDLLESKDMLDTFCSSDSGIRCNPNEKICQLSDNIDRPLCDERLPSGASCYDVRCNPDEKVCQSSSNTDRLPCDESAGIYDIC